MKILHITSSDKGGAGIAALRLHKAMLSHGLDSCFMSLDNQINDGVKYVRFNSKKEELLKPKQPLLSLRNYFVEKVKKSYSKSIKAFNDKVKEHDNLYSIYYNESNYEILSTPFSNYDITDCEAYKKADIVHFHWVAGYLDYPSFFEKNKKPIVWTIHDENPFRGAFHYKADEVRNQNQFGKIDECYKKIKYNSISNQKDLIVVSPSNWLAEEARHSEMFKSRKVVSIYNTIDTTLFKPLDKEFCRDFFNLPHRSKVFMFASQNVSNKRKGFDLLLQVIKKYKGHKNVFFLVIGEQSGILNQENVIFTGTISDDRIMAIAYSSSDYFILPSREDNLPNTMLESISCGTPLLTFAIGDFNEIIAKNSLGYIVQKTSSKGLLNLMVDIIDNDENAISEKLYEFSMNNFNGELIVKKYLEIYKSF